MRDTKYVVFKLSETLGQSLFRHSMTAVILTFCVFISRDSTWWTFITGSMFIIFLFTVISRLVWRSENKFTTKKELQQWVDSLPED